MGYKRRTIEQKLFIYRALSLPRSPTSFITNINYLSNQHLFPSISKGTCIGAFIRFFCIPSKVCTITKNSTNSLSLTKEIRCLQCKHAVWTFKTKPKLNCFCKIFKKHIIYDSTRILSTGNIIVDLLLCYPK